MEIAEAEQRQGFELAHAARAAAFETAVQEPPGELETSLIEVQRGELGEGLQGTAAEADVAGQLDGELELLLGLVPAAEAVEGVPEADAGEGLAVAVLGPLERGDGGLELLAGLLVEAETQPRPAAGMALL